ncbi:MAG: hypothetical protein M1822_009665 [Bathelium mastoideum]|nr:MAG: hypothetical protein M1822_009665 [Bathelium mastoideum]
MCSASKVRCDKRKPVCSRCQRLGYPCFYSPARRIRKRKSLSEQTVDSDSRKKADARQNVKTASTRQSHEPHLAPTGNLDGNEAFNFRNVEALSSATFNTVPNGISFARNQAGTGQEDDFSMVDLEMGGAVDSGSAQPSSLDFSAAASDLLPTLHGHGSRGSSVDSVLSECTRDNASTPSDDFDCATVALGILQRLNTSTSKRTFPPSTSGSIDTTSPSLSSASNDADVQFQNVAVAIKRASTILICPCSKRPDVGLLVATICIAMLDAFETVLHGIAPTQTNQPSRSDPATFKLSMTGTIMRDLTTALESRNRNLRDDSDVTATTMHILEQLPQIASLVTQFMKRYEQEMQRDGCDLLRALGASVMSRLRGMIDEVTDRVAQIG